MSGPSEAAVEAGSWAETLDHGRIGTDIARAALAAAHDPANFTDPLDVSVRLGDVLDRVAGIITITGASVPKIIEDTFGAKP